MLPSFTEGLPTVVLESYAAGVPVVATAVGGTPEAVADGVDGYLVPPGDPTALARRILDVLKSEDERRAMGQRGRERIRAEFTFDVQARRLQWGVRGAVELPAPRRRDRWSRRLSKNSPSKFISPCYQMACGFQA